jgi:dipeptide/tripeptide permease
MLGILVFVKLTFFIFHVMFPTYGIRVFGEGAMVGSMFGVLNPVMIVFLVPLISVLTMNVRSYTMLVIGTGLSAAAVFICFIPDSMAQAMADGWIGELVYGRWLEVPVGQRDPFYMSLLLFIVVFTVGEAIWSPRLMQFSAEIAPQGREGAYLSLAILPYFVGKALAGGLSGYLLTTYTPEGALEYPDHMWVWVWIGSMAAISPIGLLIFKNMFQRIEDDAVAEAQRYTEDEQSSSEERSDAPAEQPVES